jgi:hypothetical protein
MVPRGYWSKDQIKNSGPQKTISKSFPVISKEEANITVIKLAEYKAHNLEAVTEKQTHLTPAET